MTKFRSIKAMAEILNKGAESPTFSEHSLRHLVSAGDNNGLTPYIKRIGGKILIDEQGFIEWLESH